MKVFIFFLSLICALPLAAAEMRVDNEFTRIKVFYTETDAVGWDCLLKGTVMSLGMREIADEELRQLAQDRTKVTVRLTDRSGILEGESLYIINERNIIVARLQVHTLFRSASFGNLLIGYGNFRYVKQDFRVVQRSDNDRSRYAYVHKSRGDYHYRTGDIAMAMVEYEKAVELDPANPEAHAALGNLYLKKDIIDFAAVEYSRALQAVNRMYDRFDKYLLYRGLARTAYLRHSRSPLPLNSRQRKQIATEALSWANSGLRLHGHEAEMYYYQAYFYRHQERLMMLLHKNALLKAMAIEPKMLMCWFFSAPCILNMTTMKKRVILRKKH
jgi:tetratricopeptide (TPR) repeat protein